MAESDNARQMIQNFVEAVEACAEHGDNRGASWELLYNAREKAREEMESALAVAQAESRRFSGWYTTLQQEMESVSNRYAAACIERNQAEAELAAERARFDWWFGPAAKDINEYLRGVREGWSIEQWRAWIDAAKGTEEGREQR